MKETFRNFKSALITGFTWQDSSYLAECLPENRYSVHGIKRGASSFNTARIDHFTGNKNYEVKSLLFSLAPSTSNKNK